MIWTSAAFSLNIFLTDDKLIKDKTKHFSAFFALSSALVPLVVVRIMVLFSTVRLLYSRGELPRSNPATLWPFRSPHNKTFCRSNVPARENAWSTVSTGTISLQPFFKAVATVVEALKTSMTTAQDCVKERVAGSSSGVKYTKILYPLNILWQI